MKIDNKPKENYQPSTSRQIAGIAAGSLVFAIPVPFAIKNKITPISDKKIEKQKNIIQKFIKEIDSFETIKNHACNIILESGLKEKGVKLVIWSKDDLKKMKPLPEPKTFSQKIKYTKIKNLYKVMSNGTNAYFERIRNNVHINKKNLYSAVFHELGHAENFHSKSTRWLSILRNKSKRATPYVALGCFAVGVFAKKKGKDEKKDFKNFVHDNAGKLTFLVFSPIIIEEALASLRGFSMAKKYLSTAQQKFHIRNQAFALSTYVLHGMILAMAPTLGLFIKDKVAKT